MRIPGNAPTASPGKRYLGMLGGLVLALAATGATTLEELAADPARWPAEVSLTAAAHATVVKNGVPGGMMLLGAGRTLMVTAVGPEGVTGRIGADMVRVPADKTDLFARLDGGALKPVDAATLGGVKYFALYFSASWCGPCRRFTPEFIRVYRELKQHYPEFEAVFVSADRSAGDMRDYMREDRMPWLAVKFDQRSPDLMSYSGPGIPCLVLVGADGVVISDSYEGDNYVGPGMVTESTLSV